MRFGCDECGAQYMIADDKIGSKGAKVKCKKCGHIIVVKPAAASASGESAASGGAENADAPPDHQHSAAEGGASPDEQPPPPPQDDAFGNWGADAAGSGAGSASGGIDDQMGGAFDTLFGSGGLGGEPASQSPSVGQSEPSPSADMGGPKEWYVAIDESQIGPINVGEIEQRWKRSELDEDSLAWKPGMSDWAPIAEVSELAYLITEYPQQSQPAQSSGGSSVPSTLAGATVGPATFGSGQGSEAEVSWRPSAASALSSLVQEELVATREQQEIPQQNPPEQESTQPPGGLPAGIDMPSFGGSEATPSQGGGQSGNPAAGPAGQPGAFGAPPDAGWSLPAGPPKSSGSGKGLYIALALLAVVFLGAGAFAGYKFLLPSQAPDETTLAAGTDDKQQSDEPESDAGKDAAGDEKSTSGKGKADGKSRAAAQQQKQAAAKRAAKAKAEKKAKPERKRRRRRAKRSRPKPPSKPKRTRPKRRQRRAQSGGGSDELGVFNEGGGGKPKKAKLTIDDIVAGVKKNGPKVASCIRQAKSRGEIVPGSYKFILDWTILPTGKVVGAKMKGPSSVMGTSLPGCFKRVMQSKWRFPRSRKKSPVRNFPFGPIKVR